MIYRQPVGFEFVCKVWTSSCPALVIPERRNAFHNYTQSLSRADFLQTSQSFDVCFVVTGGQCYLVGMIEKCKNLNR